MSIMQILLQITIVLLAAIVLEYLMRRNPAARHAMLLTALVIVTMCPLLAIFAATLTRPPAAQSMHATAQTIFIAVQQNFSPPPNHALPWRRLAVATWLSGALVSLTRIGCGLARIRGLRRDARPFAGKAGVLISDKLAAPIAVGIFRPVAILPAEMTARLSARQLAQVIDHENAHVLRHDPAVALFQRLLAAALWFHPLLHWVNRRLDLAREELCDQAVLSSASPAEYSRTLLSIAAELPRARGLLRSELTSQLELRIKRLLSKRSDLMARANRWNIFALAAVFIALAVGAGCFGAAPSSRGALASATTAPADFPYAVKFEQGASKYTHHGDNITITEVHGTAATIEPGNIYRVSGTYVLKSHDAASIAAFTTAMNSADGTGSTMKVQAAEIKKGEGTFTLYLPMAIRGWPHVSFYPSGGGSDLGGTYFGNGEFVLKKWWGEK